MKQSRITRRDFFKLSAFGVGTVAASSLVGIVGAPPRHAIAEAEQPHKLAIPQPTFNPIASTTAFGAPTDLSSGWDGTLWAIDASGAPHLYDPTTDAWLAHGDGVDAAAAIGNTLYVFRRGAYDPITQQTANTQYITVNLANNTVSSGPTDVATTWPSLPDSFKLRLTGAVGFDTTLVLINGGWFVSADVFTKQVGARAKLTGLANWPTTANWADGIVDSVLDHSDGLAGVAYLFRNGEYIVVNFENKAVTQGPQPAKNVLPPSLAASGADAAVRYLVSGYTIYFQGTSAVSVPPTGGAGQTYYLPALFAQWPTTWHPVLNHAPSGRMGNLWCATKALGIVQHNGETWNIMPGGGASAAVGQDGTVMVGSASGLYRWNGTNYDALGGADLVQVSVGDASHVWVRNTVNNVFKLNPDGSTYNPNVQLSGVTHLAANADGTLWHCTSNNPNAFRLISESTNPSAQIQLKGAGIVSSVNKVASTGFGAAHCLAQHTDGSINAYRYDSPYVFKTSQQYTGNGDHIEQGLGMIYMLNGENYNLYVVALDMHTGREVSRSAPLPFNGPTDAYYQNLVFDPVLDLVYTNVSVGEGSSQTFDQTTPGQVIALDARDLTRVLWSFQTPTGVDAAPALTGTQLCFADRQKTLYMFNTGDALAQTSGKPGSAPKPAWTWQVPTAPAGTHRVVTPVLANGNAYAVVWDVNAQAPGGNQSGNVAYLAQCKAADGSGGTTRYFWFVGFNSNVGLRTPELSSPALGQIIGADGKPHPALYAGAINAVHALSVNTDSGTQPVDYHFQLPNALASITGLAYDDGTRPSGPLNSNPGLSKTRVWFGDTDGNLWSLLPGVDLLLPVDGTPFQAQAKLAVITTPVLYKDPSGGVTVLFGIDSSASGLPPSLYGYDPDNGNSASVGTGLTMPEVLSKTIANGVMYLSGGQVDLNSNNLTQVFGIRVDALPQALRDFVIESQMMQDPDQSASGGDPSNNVPPSVARYQTHLTVVDDSKTPQVHEAVKIWCDTSNTVITVDGTKFTVGPDDASYAAVKTSTDGSLVITMDATDYYAPTLRAWAGFMDPYERIVVNADAEFHQRVMTAHADANDDDPDKVNLQTATNYNGQSLFTDDEKNQNPSAPQNVANSIQTADKGLGISGGSGSSKAMYRKLMRAMGVRHKNQRVRVTVLDAAAAAATPDKYMAYADLPGATHFPTNIPSARLASIVAPIGLSFSRPNGDVTKAPTFTALSHTDARAAIDALQGEAWKPTDPQGGSGASRVAPMRTFNIWQDFWNWLKGLFDKIAQVFLSIAEDILAGIQYIVNGILKVFKAIIKVLEDVFPFLGSFFKMLDKLIDDVQAALSVLFHFGEIIKTHKFIRDQVNSLLNQAETAITKNVEPAVDNFFAKTEQEVQDAFNTLIKKIEPNKQGNNLKGAGSTPHTAFSAGRGAYGSGSGTSHAVQCSYGLQKLKSNANAGSQTSSTFGVAVDGDDAIISLWTKFTNQISTNPKLKAALDGLGSGTSNLFQSNSASDFFKNLLVTLLELIETLIEGMLVVTNAFIDLILNALADIISTVQSFLNTPIDIPFISWLYQTVFGEPLTFLNVLCLVAAIPVTILYRVIEGRYPSQDVPSATSSVGIASHRDPSAPSAGQALRPAAVNPLITKILGAFSGVLALALGIVNGINDALGEESNAFLSKLSAVLGVAATAIAIPLASSDSPSIDDWIAWGAEWCASVLGIFGAIEWTDALAELWNYFSPGLTTAMGLFEIVWFSVTFITDAQFDPNSDLSFAANLLSAFPYVINPVKLASELGAILVGGIDFYAGVAVCVIDFIVAFAGLSARPERRYFFPFVAMSNGVQGAPHPLALDGATP